MVLGAFKYNIGLSDHYTNEKFIYHFLHFDFLTPLYNFLKNKITHKALSHV